MNKLMHLYEHLENLATTFLVCFEIIDTLPKLTSVFTCLIIKGQLKEDF